MLYLLVVLSLKLHFDGYAFQTKGFNITILFDRLHMDFDIEFGNSGFELRI